MFVTQRFIKVNAPSPESQWSCISNLEVRKVNRHESVYNCTNTYMYILTMYAFKNDIVLNSIHNIFNVRDTEVY
jgi:hypothetical protein